MAPAGKIPFRRPPGPHPDDSLDALAHDPEVEGLGREWTAGCIPLLDPGAIQAPADRLPRVAEEIPAQRWSLARGQRAGPGSDGSGDPRLLTPVTSVPAVRISSSAESAWAREGSRSTAFRNAPDD